MKHLKGAAILGVGVIGGFVSCGIVVVKSVLKSETLRAGLSHAISSKVENWINSNAVYKRPKVIYRSYYDAYCDHQRGVKRRSGRYPWGSNKEQDTDIRLRDDIIFATREDAEKTVDAMKEIIYRYGRVSVADLYDLAGLTSTYKDNQYGWTNISGIDVVSDIIQGKDGYLIQLPEVSELK